MQEEDDWLDWKASQEMAIKASESIPRLKAETG